MTDEEIDRFLAEKCEQCSCVFTPGAGRRLNYGFFCLAHDEPRARYTASLDALFAPGGPVEKCSEAGIALSLGNSLDAEKWCAHMGLREVWGEHQGEFDVCLGPSPARALAEACFYALGGKGD